MIRYQGLTKQKAPTEKIDGGLWFRDALLKCGIGFYGWSGWSKILSLGSRRRASSKSSG